MGSKKKKTTTAKKKTKRRVKRKTKTVEAKVETFVPKEITYNQFGGYTNKPTTIEAQSPVPAPSQPYSNKDERIKAAKELEVRTAKLVSKSKKVKASKKTEEPEASVDDAPTKKKAKTTKKKKTKRPTTRQGRKDRVRAKKKTHKFTEKHIAMVRSQKGKMSIREICKWFAKETHYVYKISPGMVSLILNNKVHKPKEDKVSVYDLIEKAQDGEDVSEIVDVDGVDY